MAKSSVFKLLERFLELSSGQIALTNGEYSKFEFQTQKLFLPIARAGRSFSVACCVEI